MRCAPSVSSAARQASDPSEILNPESLSIFSAKRRLPSRPPQKVGADIPITRASGKQVSTSRAAISMALSTWASSASIAASEPRLGFITKSPARVSPPLMNPVGNLVTRTPLPASTVEWRM